MIYINNFKFFIAWKKIEKYLDNKDRKLKEFHSGLIIDDKFIIAGNRTLLRPVGILDWSWYTPKTLGIAMNEDRVERYYEDMLKDPRSPSNKWKNRKQEMEKKTFYAVRAGKAEYV